MKLAGGPECARILLVKTYGQYCPIARTSELLAERWTPLIIRNLLAGCRTFGEIRDGLPGIPTALLSERLERLERHGIVHRTPKASGRGSEFRLTEQGRELKAVCDAMGDWGARWLDVEPHHLDADYVLWATSKLADPARLPRDRIVIRFDMAGRPKRSFWMILQQRPEVCTTAPGFSEDLIVKTDARCLVDLNLRRTTAARAKDEGRLVVEGPPALARRFTTWFKPSPFAHIPPAT